VVAIDTMSSGTGGTLGSHWRLRGAGASSATARSAALWHAGQHGPRCLSLRAGAQGDHWAGPGPPSLPWLLAFPHRRWGCSDGVPL